MWNGESTSTVGDTSSQLSIGDRGDARTVQLATRHKTLAMAERYSDHKRKAQFDQVIRVVTEVLGGLFGDDRADGEAEAS